MEPWHLTHLVFLAAWGGLVLGETVLELAARDEAALDHAARVHYWMDLVVELPLILGALATGIVLATRAALVPLLWAKIGCGMVALGANLYCIFAVTRRYRQRGNREAVRRWSRRVRLSGAGVPFALAAAVLGLVCFRG